VSLKFLPTVLDSGVVNIQVAAEVSHLDFENGILISGFQIPSLISRKAETTVELKEGQYLILGGLLSNDVSQTISKIPILGQIPILGKLFSSKSYQSSESELLVTLSPQIIHGMSQEEISGAYIETIEPKGAQ
jgi:pilus assembly protein CpaC